MNSGSSATCALPESEVRIYGTRFWMAYAANLLLVSANALTFRFADFVAHLGGTESDSGDLVSFGVVGAVFFRLFSGGWMDRFGIARVWLLGTMTMFTGALMMFVANDIGPMLYIARFAFSTGLAILFSCSMAHIQNGAPPSHRTEVIAALGSSGFLGLMTGTLMSDVIYWFFPAKDANTFRVLFGTSALCAIAYFTIVAILTRKDEKPVHTERPPNVWIMFRRYFPGPVILCGFFMGAGFAVSSTFLTRFAETRGFSGISAFFVAYALSAFVFRVLSRTWSRRFGRHVLIFVGLVAQGVGFAVIPLAYQEWVLSLPAIAIGFGHALLFPAVVSLGTETYPAKYRGTGTTLILGSFDLGQLMLAPLFGRMIVAFGFETMFLTTGASATLIAIFYGLRTRGVVDNDGRQHVTNPPAQPASEGRETPIPARPAPVAQTCTPAASGAST